MLKLESLSFIEVQAPRDISGNKKYQLNPSTYLPKGTILLDLINLFEKTPRTLQLPFLNMSTNYESIPRGSLLGTFEPVNEEVNEIHTTSCEKLEGQVRQAHAQLQRKGSYRKARKNIQKMEKEPYQLLPDYLPSSSMEMETIMRMPKMWISENPKSSACGKQKLLASFQSHQQM